MLDWKSCEDSEIEALLKPLNKLISIVIDRIILCNLLKVI